MASLIAGTATFLAAVYLGMILFSPDSSSAGTPDQSPSSGPSQGDGGEQQQQQDQQDGGRQGGDDEQDD